MIGNFPTCDAFTAQSEGGFTDNPADPGNWTGGVVNVGRLLGTKYGIAASAHPDIDIPNLTPEAASMIRETQYWYPVNGDRLPPAFDLMVYDMAVNAGPPRSAKILQGLLSVAQDGVIGMATLAAINARPAASLLQLLLYAQKHFYETLPGFSTFGHGWMTRADQRYAAALKLLP